MSGCERVGGSGGFSLTQIPGALVQIPVAAVSGAGRAVLRCLGPREKRQPPSNACVAVLNNKFLPRAICDFLQPGVESACAAKTCRSFRAAMEGHCERLVRFNVWDLNWSYGSYPRLLFNNRMSTIGDDERDAVYREIFKRCKNLQQLEMGPIQEKLLPASMPSVRRLVAQPKSIDSLGDVTAFAERFPSLQDCALSHAGIQELEPLLKRVPLRSLHLSQYPNEENSCRPRRGIMGSVFSLETASECSSLRRLKLTNFHIGDDLLQFIIHKLPKLESLEWTAEKQDGLVREGDGDFFKAVMDKWPADCLRPPARNAEKLQEYVQVDLYLDAAELATLRKLSSSWDLCLQFLLEKTTVVKWKGYQQRAGWSYGSLPGPGRYLLYSNAEEKKE